MDIHIIIILFITLPFGCPWRICLIKTFTKKKSKGKKILVKEKEYNIQYICLVKNLTRKTHWYKTMVKGKIVQDIFISPPHPNNHLWDNEDQSFESVVQKLCLKVTLTLWKGIQYYHTNKFVDCLSHILSIWQRIWYYIHEGLLPVFLEDKPQVSSIVQP